MSHRCPECRLIPERVEIYFSSEQRQEAQIHPVRLGLFVYPDWLEHQSLYLFTCKKCNFLAIDFPRWNDQGKSRDPRCYFKCSDCGNLQPVKEGYVYSDAIWGSRQSILDEFLGVLNELWRRVRLFSQWFKRKPKPKKDKPNDPGPDLDAA